MRKRRWLCQRGVQRWRGRAYGGAQGAVQGGRFKSRTIPIALNDQFHTTGAGTHHVHRFGLHHGRGNRHAHRQSKPHQHEADDICGVTQILHSKDSKRAHFFMTFVCRWGGFLLHTVDFNQYNLISLSA